jgi:putative addiction module component (TIGR02574 family)
MEGHMIPTTEQVLDAAMAMPDGDRIQLLEALIASLQPTDRPPFDDSWREVIRRRSTELRSGTVTPVPWEEVKGQARERAGGAGRIRGGTCLVSSSQSVSGKPV